MPNLSEMMAKRDQLERSVKMMSEAQRDIASSGAEGAKYAGYAAAWAAVIMVTDILRDCISFDNPEAAAGFEGIDKAVEGANKVLTAFGKTPITRKEDLVNSLDPELRNVNTMSGYTGKALKWLLNNSKKISPTSKKQLGLVVTLATDMTQDTLLMLQAGEDQNRITAGTAAALSRGYLQIERVRLLLFKINDQITYYFEQSQTLAATA